MNIFLTIIFLNNLTIFFTSQENFVKLAELQRDLGGYEHLLHPEREFLREGCLQKLSRKGYQQRMFFLVSTCLFRGGGSECAGCTIAHPLF